MERSKKNELNLSFRHYVLIFHWNTSDASDASCNIVSRENSCYKTDGQFYYRNESHNRMGSFHLWVFHTLGMFFLTHWRKTEMPVVHDHDCGKVLIIGIRTDWCLSKYLEPSMCLLTDFGGSLRIRMTYWHYEQSRAKENPQIILSCCCCFSNSMDFF